MIHCFISLLYPVHCAQKEQKERIVVYSECTEYAPYFWKCFGGKVMRGPPSDVHRKSNSDIRGSEWGRGINKTNQTSNSIYQRDWFPRAYFRFGAFNMLLFGANKTKQAGKTSLRVQWFSSTFHHFYFDEFLLVIFFIVVSTNHR